MIKQFNQINYSDKKIDEYKNTNNTTNNIINSTVDIETLDLDSLIEDGTITPFEGQKDINSIVNNEQEDNDLIFFYKAGTQIESENRKSGNIKDDDKLRGYIAQGMTVAGKYRIYAFCQKDPYTDEVTKSAIRIVDKNGKVVKTLIFDNPEIIRHANDLEYDSKTGRVYIATMRRDSPLVSFELAKALKCKSSRELKFRNESEMFKKSGLSNLSGVTHDKSTDIWYLANGHTIVMIKDGKVIKKIKKETKKTKKLKHEAQGIFAKDGKLYVIRFNRNNDYRSNGGKNVKADDPNASANMIDVYDENGNYVETIPVKAPKTKNGYVGELESISYDEERGTFVANYYYKTDEYQNSRDYWTADLPIRNA